MHSLIHRSIIKFNLNCYSRFKDGQEFEASERFQVTFDDIEDTLSLVFQHVTPNDAGLYTCVASTSSGKISCSAELTVQGLALFLMHLIRLLSWKSVSKQQTP